MVTVVEQLTPVCVGIDVGQIRDNTAISVAEVAQKDTGKIRYTKPTQTLGHFEQGVWVAPDGFETVLISEYMIRTIRRLPLGTSYPEVALSLADMLCNPLFAHRDVRVLIDVTGVGRPVYDDLSKEIGLRKEARHILLKPISFVRGEKYNRKTGTLGKAYLVSRLQSLLQGGRVHAPDTAEMKVTLEELRVYEIKVDQDGNDTYGASIGKHDDLATALALSCLEDPHGERATYSQRVY